mmetsp:Transcript_8226/g.17534  ORF Transcript_8226/g.17534 Transcript_8226/m.17534 type:complete len:105 (-) Transcript_8226:2017-2331(-)
MKHTIRLGSRRRITTCEKDENELDRDTRATTYGRSGIRSKLKTSVMTKRSVCRFKTLSSSLSLNVHGEQMDNVELFIPWDWLRSPALSFAALSSLRRTSLLSEN